jgi:hypothetical protein
MFASHVILAQIHWPVMGHLVQNRSQIFEEKNWLLVMREIDQGPNRYPIDTPTHNPFNEWNDLLSIVSNHIERGLPSNMRVVLHYAHLYTIEANS